MNATTITITRARNLVVGAVLLDHGKITKCTYHQVGIRCEFEDGTFRTFVQDAHVRVVLPELVPFVGDPFAGLV